jgi:hypothetical protein
LKTASKYIFKTFSFELAFVDELTIFYDVEDEQVAETEATEQVK